MNTINATLNQNKLMKKMPNYNINPTNNTGYNIEAEILKKVEDYKKKLMSDLLKVLSEEKFKEEERELTYQKTTNPIEKKRLEKIISMERAQSSERIMKINEYIIYNILGKLI